MSAGFDKRATVTASTKRPPSLASGIRGPAVTNLTDLSCWALQPLDRDTAYRLQIETPLKRQQTFMRSAGSAIDIQQGDILVIGSVEYPVKHVDSWPAVNGETEYHIIVEVLNA